MGPLTGMKVVDLTHVMAGPTCTLMLADMGAEVIKIEKIPAGDDTRYMVPPKIGDVAASFLMMNRNKKGIALDLKTPGGARVLRRLIEAEEAAGLGLLNEVVEDRAGLERRANELARLVASHAPLTLRSTKQAMLQIQPKVVEDEELILMCYESQDFREGMDAFLNKRPPQWTGE